MTGASDSGMVMKRGSTSIIRSGSRCSSPTSSGFGVSSSTGPAHSTTGVITYPERLT